MSEALYPFDRELAVSLERIAAWDLPEQMKRVLRIVVALSFGEGLESVLMSYFELHEWTTIHPGDVGRVVKAAVKLGVLQVRGPRYGARLFRFLPNAILVTPPVRLEPAVVERLLRQHAAQNTGGTHWAPTPAAGKFQGLLGVVTGYEPLADEQAAASLALALEGRGSASGGSPRPAPALSGLRDRQALEQDLERLGVGVEEIAMTRCVSVETVAKMVADRADPAWGENAGVGKKPSRCETDEFETESVKNRVGKKPSPQPRAYARPERSSALLPLYPAPPDRCTAVPLSGGAGRSVARGERLRAPTSHEAEVLEKALAWLSEGDEQDRDQTRHAAWRHAWSALAVHKTRALRHAVEIGIETIAHGDPIEKRWPWLRSVTHRLWDELQNAREEQPR